MLPSNVVSIQGMGQVSADSLNTYCQGCTTVAKLRTFVGVSNMQVSLLGLTKVGDGGAGLFYWVSGNGFVDDGQNVIVPTGYLTGAWLRTATAGFTSAWLFGSNNANGATSMFTPAGFYGVMSDGVTNDTTAMIAAMNALASQGGGALVLPPNSTTLITPGQVSIPSNVVLMSFGSHNPNAPTSAAVIQAAQASSQPLLQVNGINGRIRGWGLRNLMLNCNGLCPGFNAYRTDSDILVECVTVVNATSYGWQCYNCWDATFVNLVISLCGDPGAPMPALNIIPEPTQDNCNSLKFYGLRIEGSKYANMAIRGNTSGGPSNNIFFHGCKFHLRNNGTGLNAAAPNCIFESADNICFYGAQFFDSGTAFPVLLFQNGAANNYANYIFDGAEIDTLNGSTLASITTPNSGFNITFHKCVLTRDFGKIGGTVTGFNLADGYSGQFQNFAPMWVNFLVGDIKYQTTANSIKRILNIISGTMLADPGLPVNWQVGSAPGSTPLNGFGIVANPPPRVAFNGPVTHTLTEAEMEASCVYCNAAAGNIALTMPDGNAQNSASWRSWFTRFLRYDGSGNSVTVAPKSGQKINGATTPYTLATGFMTFTDFQWDSTTGNWFAMTAPITQTAPGGWPTGNIP